MGVNNSCEDLAFTLSANSFGKEIIVARKEYPPESRRAVKQFTVRQLVAAVLVRGQHIDSTVLQARDDGLPDVVVSVE